MAKLSAEQRKRLPAKVFAGPNRSFPIPDKNHARAALLLVNRAKGLTAAQKERIRARARRMLKGGKGGLRDKVRMK